LVRQIYCCPKSGSLPCYPKATRAPTGTRAGEWSRVVVDPRHAEKLHAREPGDLFGVPRWGPVPEGRAPHAGHVRRRELGSRRSTDEAAEPRGSSLGGGGGGKGASQGERRSASHAPDTVRGHACSRGRQMCGRRSYACHYYPRQEPYAVVPLVQICAAGGQQWSSLPRPLFSRSKFHISKLRSGFPPARE
jgi:hypothetical protein